MDTDMYDMQPGAKSVMNKEAGTSQEFTNKEVLLTALRGEQTWRKPVMLLSSGVWNTGRFGWSLQDTFTKPAEETARLLIKSAEEINGDVIWMAADCSNILLAAMGAEVYFGPPGEPSAVLSPLLRDGGSTGTNIDADIDHQIHQLKKEMKIHTRLQNDPAVARLLEVTRLVAGKVGEKYLIGISQWGPLTMAGLMVGTENLMKMILRSPEKVQKVLDFAAELLVAYWTLFKEAGAELLCMAEPSASGSMISPILFETVALPNIRKAFKQAPEGAAKMLHICGNTTKVLERIPETGADFFSMDYSVDLKKAKAVLDGKIAFAGQVDPVGVLLEGSREDVKQAAGRCIREAGASQGYILMPGCDVPPKTNIENVKMLVDAAYEFKGDERETS